MRNQRLPKFKKTSRAKSKPSPISCRSLLTLILVSLHHHTLQSMALSTCGMQLFLNVPRCSGANFAVASNATAMTSSEISSSQGNKNNLAQRAARAMNSIAFLKQLVRQKDTSDEMYFRHSIHNPVDTDLDLEYDNTMEKIQPLEIMTSCQYTGILWFLPKTVRFQESIHIAEISPCGQCTTLECLTQYQTRKQEWVDCSKVTCTFQPTVLPSRPGSVSEKETTPFVNMEMKVSSEILVKIPMVGIANKAIQRKIRKTFEIAAGSYLNQIGILPENLAFTV